MKFSLIAAIAGVSARRLVQRDMNVQLNFADGMEEEDIYTEHIRLN